MARKFGVDDGARTHDRRNHNPELYQLSYAHHCSGCVFYPVLKPLVRPTYGAPGRTRTCNPRLRRPVLYPVELRALCGLVGVERFELPTHCSQSSCATRLRYTPTRCTAGHYRGIWGGTSMPVLCLSRLTIIIAKRIMRCLICARSSAG